MSSIESLPFKYNSKEYILLVQPKKSFAYTDYHVTAVTDDVKSKLYVNFVFRWDGKKISLLDMQSSEDATNDFINSLGSTIFDQIISKNKH